MLKKVIQVISLIILMLVLIACKTHPKGEKKETPAPVIVGIETVYFPAFPQPPEDIIALDKDNNIVTSTEVEIDKVVIPYWYWNLIIDYVEETEAAVTSLTAHPP